MASARLPFIRGRTHKSDYYQSPKGGPSSAIQLPPRDPTKHRSALLTQLDAMSQQVTERNPSTRDPDAVRETIIVQPESGFELNPGPLGLAADVRVIGTMETGDVLLDAKSAELPHLRKKLDDFANDAKKTLKGLRANAPAIAPIAVVRLATHQDLMGPRIREAALEPGVTRWFEIGCVGGVRSQAGSERSRRQIARQLQKVGHVAPQEFPRDRRGRILRSPFVRAASWCHRGCGLRLRV